MQCYPCLPLCVFQMIFALEQTDIMVLATRQHSVGQSEAILLDIVPPDLEFVALVTLRFEIIVT